MTTPDEARRTLDATADIEQNQKFRAHPVAAFIFALLFAVTTGAWAYHAWIVGIVAFLLTAAFMWPARKHLFREHRTRLKPTDDPFKDPYVRGSWLDFALYPVMLGIMFLSPGGSWPWAIAAGAVGFVSAMYFLRREARFS